MACDAEIIAIGPFSRRIVSALGYPEEQYTAVADGETVVTPVFVAFGTMNSEALARSFGVGRWELGHHHLDASVADLETLRRDFDAISTDRFVTLRDSGFEFYFMPNG